MFDGLFFFIEFFLEQIQNVGQMVEMFFTSLPLIQGSFMFAPTFLQPILVSVLCVAIVMWVVNIL